MKVLVIIRLRYWIDELFILEIVKVDNIPLKPNSKDLELLNFSNRKDVFIQFKFVFDDFLFNIPEIKVVQVIASNPLIKRIQNVDFLLPEHHGFTAVVNRLLGFEPIVHIPETETHI